MLLALNRAVMRAKRKGTGTHYSVIGVLEAEAESEQYTFSLERLIVQYDKFYPGEIVSSVVEDAKKVVKKLDRERAKNELDLWL